MRIAYNEKKKSLNLQLSFSLLWLGRIQFRKKKKTFGAFCGVPGILMVSIVGRSKSLIN